MKLRVYYMIIIYCLFQILTTPLSAQTLLRGSLQKLQELVSQSYDLNLLKMSDDGEWIVVKKTMDNHEETVLLFNANTSDSIVLSKQDVVDLHFISKDFLIFLYKNGKAEYIDLRKHTLMKTFEQVKKIESISKTGQFLLWYSPAQNSRLIIYAADGSLIRSIDSIKFYTLGSFSGVYAVQEEEIHDKKTKKYNILKLSGSSVKPLYTSDRMIERIQIDENGKSLISFERDEETGYMKLVYVDLQDLKNYKMEGEVLFHDAVVKTIKGGQMFHLNLLINKEKPPVSVVDIWYYGDNNLEKKFLPDFQEDNYLWEPKNCTLYDMKSDTFKNSINIYNERYFLVFNADALKDYIQKPALLSIFLYDRKQNTSLKIDTIGRELYSSAKGEYLIYPKNNKWYLYSTADQKAVTLSKSGLGKPYFSSDARTIIFDGVDAVWSYDIKNARFRALILNAAKGSYHIVNGRQESLLNNYLFFRSIMPDSTPVIVEYKDENNNTGYKRIYHNKSENIIPVNEPEIRSLLHNPSFKSFVYTQENHHLPPAIMIIRNRKIKKIYQDNMQDQESFESRRDIIEYKGNLNQPLKGILYYPVQYNPSQKYPMVVHIYENQSHLSSRYWRPTYKNSLGFNVRLLREKGYFVFLPDIDYGSEGPGISALHSVQSAMKAVLSNVASIDSSKAGLIGQSFGGYETNFIATHSDLFKAYVSGASDCDIIHNYHAFSYHYNTPQFWRYEAGQFRIGKPFVKDKEIYFRNNPLYAAERVTAPILLWSGMKDQNVDWNETRTFFDALKRNNKKVTALFYPDDGHVMWREASQIDLTKKILDWFDYYLKDIKTAEWIKEN